MIPSEPGRGFQEIKEKLDKFDRSILEQWKAQVDMDRGSTWYNYVATIPDFDFPAESELLKPLQPNGLSLINIATMPDVGGESDMTISMRDMMNRFSFPATPVERPKIQPASRKKKRKDKKDKKEHRRSGKRAPGDPPKSESTVFRPAKKR